VNVSTVVDTTDTVSTRYTAPAAMGLSVQLAFCTMSTGGDACDWTPYGAPGGPFENHTTTVLGNTNAPDGSGGRLDLRRANGNDTYSVSCSYQLVAGSAVLEMRRTARHAFALFTNTSGTAPVTVDLSCRYELNCCVGPVRPTAPDTLARKAVPPYSVSVGNAASAWKAFWEGGAMADISGHTNDTGAFELERRVIQSMYLMRSQEAGTVPPQESALL